MSARPRIRNVHTGRVYDVIAVDAAGVLTQCPADYAVSIAAAVVQRDFELVTA